MLNVIQYLLGLGPSVMMPIIVFVLALVLGIHVGKAFRSALTIGVGFIAINLVVGLLVNTLSPATKAMVENVGVRLDVVDVGWPVGAAISFGTAAVVPWVFVLGILLNVVMLALNWTKTADIDMWNYWHFVFTAAFVNVAMRGALGPVGGLAVGVVVALLSMVVTLKLADWTAPVVEEFYELPGVSLPHMETVAWAPISYVVDKFIDRIPRVRDWHADPGTIQERYGVLGESVVIGSALGLIIALLGFGPVFFGGVIIDPATNAAMTAGDAFKLILNTAISLGAVMMVLPRMVRILMEGLLPLSDGAREFITKRFPGRQIYIGLDAAVAIGHPACIATGLILVPVALVLAILLNLVGLNRMLPFADLAILPFYAIWAVGWSRGNIVRGVINGTVFLAGMLMIATNLSPMLTQMARDNNFAFPAGALSIASIDVGAHLTGWLLALPFTLYLTYGVGALISVGIAVLALFWLVYATIMRQSTAEAKPITGPAIV
jgi:galactitol PTS system EIIC component